MAAAAIEPSWTTTLFAPSTRYRALYRVVDRSDSYLMPEAFSEVELLPHLTLPDIVAATIGWESFCQFASNSKEERIAHGIRAERVVWMTPNVHIRMQNSVLHDPLIAYRLALYLETRVLIPGTNTYRKRYLSLHVAESSDQAEATATCDFLLRLVATSELSEVVISGEFPFNVATPLSGTGLSLFFQESPKQLRRVKFFGHRFNADQCRAIATMSRIDVELKIDQCSLAEADPEAEAAFVDFLQSSGGPLRLHECFVDGRIMARGLAGQSRATHLCIQFDSLENASEMFRALADNMSLLELNLEGNDISKANWRTICQSLVANPSLLNINLQRTNPRAQNGLTVSLSDEAKKERTRAIADMLAENTVLKTIQLLAVERDEIIYRDSILPRLEMNAHRPRIVAVNAIDDMPFRQKVLYRALVRVRRNPDLVWTFLSQNVDAIACYEQVLAYQDVIAARRPTKLRAPANGSYGQPQQRKRCRLDSCSGRVFS
jgi:hypothetical protein